MKYEIIGIGQADESVILLKGEDNQIYTSRLTDIQKVKEPKGKTVVVPRLSNGIIPLTIKQVIENIKHNFYPIGVSVQIDIENGITVTEINPTTKIGDYYRGVIFLYSNSKIWENNLLDSEKYIEDIIIESFERLKAGE